MTNNYSISVTYMVAVLAVSSERVSRGKFPDLRENTGNRVDFGTRTHA
jgi:hypothetical protein